MENQVNPILRAVVRRLRLAQAALAWERGWPAAWPLVATLGVFLALALFGVFGILPVWAHIALLAGFAAAIEAHVAAGTPYFAENIGFHLSIAAASGNQLLYHSIENLIGRFRDVRERINRSLKARPTRDPAEHRIILGQRDLRPGRLGCSDLLLFFATLKLAKRLREHDRLPHEVFLHDRFDLGL